MPYMYIVECSDGTYYVGSTWHLLERIDQHNTGLGSVYTRARMPVKLLYSEEYPSIAEAFGREKQVQGWSRRKRRALIEQRGSELPAIVRKEKAKRAAVRRNEPPPIL